LKLSNCLINAWLDAIAQSKIEVILFIFVSMFCNFVYTKWTFLCA